MNKLFLLGLMLALPVWAGEAAPTVPVTQTSGFVQLHGAPKKVRSMLETLEQSDAFKAAGCEAAASNKSGSLAGVTCNQPNSALTDTLNRLAPHGVKWSMSVQGCAVGCSSMPCPSPGGPVVCCKKVSGVCKPC
jgi:hypothetical protein